MTHDEKLESLRMELARQDAALEDARRQAEALPQLAFDVAPEWLRELEDACAPTGLIPKAIVVGIRG